MSDKQLGWDQLFKSAFKTDGKTEEKVAPVKEEASEPKPEPSKKTAEKSIEKPAEKTGETTRYSKKNWGKLEFKTKPSATPPKSDSVSVPVADLSAETKKEKTQNLFDENPSVETPPEIQENEPEVLTVSELNKSIREILEGRFPLFWLKGEISNFKAHTSGHFYFSLKDSKAQISAVMFKGFNAKLKFRPEDGMEVLVRGKITVYEPRGNYQIFCELMEPVGAGALQKAYEQLKAKLQKEGLFDEARKRPLPTLPRHIAIVTSPTGAAIRDMLNVLGRRFKGARITLVPCKVQGDQAPGEIVNAIALANQLKDLDVMIVGRGGGSIEDLWAFNDERVARAIAGAKVPVISAVGHEVDFTIADFVADLRAPTPSAAAELVVKNAADLIERVKTLSRGLRLQIFRQITMSRQAAIAVGKRLVDPQRRIQDAAIRCDELMQRLENGRNRFFQERRARVELLEEKLGTPLPRIARDLEIVAGLDSRLRTGVKNTQLRKRERLELNMAVLDSLSPLKVLDRGYSMVVSSDGAIVTDSTSLSIGDTVTVRMCKGKIEAQVTKTEKKR